MKPKINFYLDDETLHYNIKKSYGKVIFENNQNILLFEVESTDDLDHVEGDSLQNEFPEVILTIEDFPVNCSELEQLMKQKIEIPESVGQVTNEDGETLEVYYTNLNLNDEADLETLNNNLEFYQDEEGDLCVHWIGECEHFNNENETIKFELHSKLNQQKEDKIYSEL